ncbi:sensor histidine kinase [Thiospirillum jenense]|uniref:Histidine kinase n=1 Tax=Thiospirillum jenense TaxID=1653858 RepID=A0A839HE04_9GAMM|nr:histidine kinase [Thiospirillum jenense]MBB1125616.1 histidine kinase [Thiospirillum jenense]
MQLTKRDELLPDFCSVPMVLGVVVYGELLAILLTLASPMPLNSFWLRLGPLSVFAQLSILTNAALLCVIRPHLVALNPRLAAILAWALIPITTAAVLFTMFIGLPADIAADLLPHDGMVGLLIRSIGIAAIVGLVLLRYLYLHQQWRQQVEMTANTRFKLLQARIRPHFLFNSMNTIANLTRTDPQLAEEIVEDLADLFRAAIATERELTTLAEELDLVRRYLHIEQQRLGERLQVIWAIDELPEALMTQISLPLLTLQPLVENAVYHGIQPSVAPGFIRIAGKYQRGRLQLIITNSLPSEPPMSSLRGHQVALENVRQRLAAHLPGRATLNCSRDVLQYQVCLTITIESI